MFIQKNLIILLHIFCSQRNRVKTKVKLAISLYNCFSSSNNNVNKEVFTIMEWTHKHCIGYFWESSYVFSQQAHDISSRTFSFSKWGHWAWEEKQSHQDHNWPVGWTLNPLRLNPQFICFTVLYDFDHRFCSKLNFRGNQDVDV